MGPIHSRRMLARHSGERRIRKLMFHRLTRGYWKLLRSASALHRRESLHHDLEGDSHPSDGLRVELIVCGLAKELLGLSTVSPVSSVL